MDEAGEYRELLSRMDTGQTAAETARTRVVAAEEALSVAAREYDEVEARAGELWAKLGRRLGPRRRRLGPLPEPDRAVLSGGLDASTVDVSQALDTAAVDIGEPPPVGLPRRVGRVLQPPLAGAACGAAGFGGFWWWLGEFGVTVFGVLGLAGLVLGPLTGMVLGVWLRQRHADDPTEQPEPWVVVLALVPALAAEAILYGLTR